jgi:hypothetical protein
MKNEIEKRKGNPDLPDAIVRKMKKEGQWTMQGRERIACEALPSSPFKGVIYIRNSLVNKETLDGQKTKTV